jgi:catechol 2,3-dioxygenase-like lactoylglutathione lyase family enzyme
MKTHVSFATSDLDRSVAFYAALLDAKPEKHLADYALFVTDEPALELALDHRAAASASRSDHFGIFVESAEEVERAIARLAGAGLQVEVERDQVCCYARQTKVWATDPDGRRWETYYVAEETEERDGANAGCCAEIADDATACCAG